MSLALKKLVLDIKDNISLLFPVRRDNKSSLDKIAIFSLNYLLKIVKGKPFYFIIHYASEFDTTNSTKRGPIPLLSFHRTKNTAIWPIVASP